MTTLWPRIHPGNTCIVYIYVLHTYIILNNWHACIGSFRPRCPWLSKVNMLSTCTQQKERERKEGYQEGLPRCVPVSNMCLLHGQFTSDSFTTCKFFMETATREPSGCWKRSGGTTSETYIYIYRYRFTTQHSSIYIHIYICFKELQGLA